MKKLKTSEFLYSIILSLLLIVSISISLVSSKSKIHDKFDLMYDASSTTLECFNAIKQYRLDNGLGIGEEDSLDSGMIGDFLSNITTTDGVLDAKLTTVNPNWAAVYINMFDEIGLVEGDEVAMMFSGSFPCLNTAAIVAANTLGLKILIMASVGASSYGANLDNFCYIDMIHVLETKGLISYDYLYTSPGGHDDNGPSWWEEDDTNLKIIDRINNYGYNYIDIQNYYENVNYRVSLIESKLPNIKCFINVGAQTLSIGLNECSIIESKTKVGLIKASTYSTTHLGNKDIGLVETFLNKGISCIHMLKVANIASNYDLPYAPSVIAPIGEGGCYYETKYNLLLPIISSVIAVVSITYYSLKKKKEKQNG